MEKVLYRVKTYFKGGIYSQMYFEQLDLDNLIKSIKENKNCKKISIRKFKVVD